MKLMIFISLAIFSTLGSWLGAALLDHGNWLGGWSILFGGVGGFFGIWVGWKAAQYIGL